MRTGPGVCILRWLQAGAHRRSHLGLAGSWRRSPGLELRAMALMPVPAWGGGDFPSPGSATRTWQTYLDALFLKTTRGEISPKVAKKANKQTSAHCPQPARHWNGMLSLKN